MSEFEALESARVGILAVYAGMKWRLKPTIHYATNEALEFAYIDGTWYHTLNEGGEGEHKEVKEMAKNSMKNIIVHKGELHCYQKVMMQQQQMRALRKRGYAPPQHELVPVTFPIPSSSTTIKPPKYLIA